MRDLAQLCRDNTWQYPTAGLWWEYAVRRRLKAFKPSWSSAGCPGNVLGRSCWSNSQNLSGGAVHSTVICNTLYGIQYVELRESEACSSTRLHEAYQPQQKCIQFRFCRSFFTFSIWLLHFSLGLELLMDFEQRPELLLTVPLASTPPSACCARSAW